MDKSNAIPYKRQYSGQATELKAQTGKNKIHINISKNFLILFGIAILLGRASILNGLAPFGVAFFITILSKDRRYGVIGLGVLSGILIGDAGVSLVKYGLIMSISGIVFYYIREKIKLRVWSMALIAGTSVFLSGMIYLVFTEIYLYDVFMLGFEAVVVFVFVYILNFSVPILLQKSNRKILSNEELICIAISGAVAISGLGSMGIAGISFKNILGILLTLIFAYNGGSSVGAGVGITIGIITSMSTIGTPTVIGIYGFSGLLAGIFKDLGKFGAGIGIVLGNAILTFYINGSSEIIIKYQEIAAALLLFVIMPKSFTVYMEKFVNSSTGINQLDRIYSDRIKNLTFSKLEEYSDAFSELAVTYGNILEKNKIVEQSEVADIVDQVVDRVCNQCGMCRSCWKNNFYTTYNGVVDVIGILEASGKASKEKTPEALRKRCIRLNELLQAITDMFEIYKIHYYWQKKLFEGRQLVAEQFKGVSEIIGDLAKDINNKVEFKTEIEDALYVAFDKEGVTVDKVTILSKENDKLEIDVERRSCFDRKQCSTKIRPIVSKLLGKEFIRKNNRCTGNDSRSGVCTFKLVEAPKYHIMQGVVRVSKGNDSICGDNYSFIELEEGKYMMALSDGMGSGERAGKESRATVTLLEQLMDAGFDKDFAIKTINSILMLKSSDEIFSTMDLSIVDLYSGKIEFVKIGAASSFIKRMDGSVEVIKSSSLPIGILNKIDIDSFDKNLSSGDCVVMMSDGILDAEKNMEEKEKWVVDFLKEVNSRNPQFIAEELLRKAIEKYSNKIEDDMTVLATKIWTA